MIFQISETIIRDYDKKRIAVYRTPCGQELPKIQIRYEQPRGKDGSIDLDANSIETKKTLTQDDIIHKHCRTCIECKIVSGISKATVLTQDQVAHLFGLGIDGKRSGFHQKEGYGIETHFRSENGILWHYSTIEAIRTKQGKIIKNRECWGGGYAHCSSPRNIDYHMDLTTAASHFGISDDDLRDIQVIDAKDGNWSDDVLYRIGDQYFINGHDDNSRFVSELSTKPSSLKQAFEELKPEIARKAKSHGLEVKRQGELFFVPISDKTYFGKLKITDIQVRAKERIMRTWSQCTRCGTKSARIETTELNIFRALRTEDNQLCDTTTANSTNEAENKLLDLYHDMPEFSEMLKNGKVIIVPEPLTFPEVEEHRSEYTYYSAFGHSFRNLPKETQKCFKDNGGKIDTMKVHIHFGWKYADWNRIPEHDSHTATQIGKLNGYVVVRGIVRHTDHDHKDLKLGDQWHIVAMNTQKSGISVQRQMKD